VTKKYNKFEIAGSILVLIMALLQVFYAVFAYIDPAAFSNLRGTELFSEMDSDWIKIYGSRTLFITLVLGYLLYSRNYMALMWCALFGTVMPITDGLLAYEAKAPFKVVLKHVATIVYLLITCLVLNVAVEKNQQIT